MERIILPRPAPRLTAIIATYQRYQVLPAAISSLLAQTLPPGEVEIIVIDNSPDQEAAAAFAGRYAGIAGLSYLCEPVPGLSNARNTGLARAAAPIVAYLDDDAVADPGWAAALLEAFAAMPGAGAVGGPSRPLWRGQRPGWLGDDMLGHLSILDHGRRLRALPAGQTIVGCNMAFRRDRLLAAGGFNPSLGRNGPELALLSNGEPGVLNKIRDGGDQVVYAPGAIVDHQIDASRLDQHWFRRRAAWQAVSDYLMDPAGTAAHAKAAARHLRLVETSGARPRGVGFFGAVDTPEDFAAEMLLIRELMIATLHGGAESEARARPGRVPAASRIAAGQVLRARRRLQKSALAVAAVRLARRQLRNLRAAIGIEA